MATTTLFCLISVGGKSCGLKFSVAHINFIVLALVNISNFIALALPWFLIQICKQKIRTNFSLENYSGPLQIMIKKFMWVIKN